jgi:hypothetical protein
MKELINTLSKIKKINHKAAIIMALTTIDIASRLEYPSFGKVKNKVRYKRWLDNFFIPLFEDKNSTIHIISSADIYNLRCNILHEGKNFETKMKAKNEKNIYNFMLVKNTNSHRNKNIGTTVMNGKVIQNNIIQVNIDVFINEIISSLEKWIEKRENNNQDHILPFVIKDGVKNSEIF